MNHTTSPVSVDPYAMDIAEVLSDVDSGTDGLSSAEAAARLRRDGPNVVPTGKRAPAIVRFIKHFDDILIYILLAAAALKAAMGDWVDFGVIVAVALINTTIGFVQEGRAEHALAGIRAMLSAHAQARRDGEWAQVSAEDLVVGDVVRVGPGARVPADIRLIEANNLRVEEAALTGESEPAVKGVEPVEAETGIGDRTCMLYSSSIVAAGSGIGVVTATGLRAEIGRITTLLSQIDSLDTPLTKQITRFGKFLALLIAGMVVVMALIGKVLHQMPFGDLASATIGFAVSAIPEGLPALVTITLALGVRQMARRRAIVRRLSAVEALGSVTAICSDKTGTLTTNEMMVRQVVTADGVYKVTGLGYEPVGEIIVADGVAVSTGDGSSCHRGRFQLPPGTDPVATGDGSRWQPVTLDTGDGSGVHRGHPDLARLVLASGVAIDATITQGESGRWTLVGEPTEGALRTLGLKTGFDAGAYPRLAHVPFDSEHKYSATLTTADGQPLIGVVGAPDRLLDRSTTQGNDQQPLDRAWWDEQIEAASAQGLRVLGVAWRTLEDVTKKRDGSVREPLGTDSRYDALDHDDLVGLCFAGLAAIVDPPRPEAIAAIATCHTAGITVTMITGDHAGTAAAIADEMGIRDRDDPEGIAAVTGAELEAATDKQLRHIVGHTQVFARTSPEHKLRLVKAMQANKEVVAMTGDGVNDAPALKRADVGVAMGIKGTEATKEAADIVLADDNFATIEYAIEEGRRIHDNLHKSVLFLLPTNGAQALVVLVAVVFGFTLPLSPVQILWVNMVTAVTLSLALAYEPAEPDIMTRPPRPPGAPLVSLRDLPRIALASAVIAAATLGAFSVAQWLGTDVAVAQTWAVNTLALGQAAYLFNSRFLRESALRREAATGNRVVWVVIAILLALQVLFAYVPIIHVWFGSAAIGWQGWLLPVGLGVGIFLVMELVKVALRRYERG